MKPILKYSPILRAEFTAFLQAKRAHVDSINYWGADFFDKIIPFATSGKLLRGNLICFSYELFSHQPPDKSVLNAAMALELTHSALLIHDDIMDGDELRRGQPSLHNQYHLTSQKKGLSNNAQLGINLALCGGDAILFLALELLANVADDAAVRSTVNRLFSEHLVNTCFGQMQDVYLEARPAMPSKKAIYKLMEAKTAAYSLALPLAMGAALARQPTDVLHQLQTLGITAGTIFQIRDDELGIMGDSRQTGKPVGSDIKAGKKTLFYYFLLKSCTASERQKLKTVFGNPDINTTAVAYVQKLAIQHKVPQQLNDEIYSLQQKASNFIGALDIDNQSKGDFSELMLFCARRQF